MKKMLILRGKAGHYDGRDWPRGALYEEPALEYARRRGYEGVVLNVAGVAYADSPQVNLTLAYMLEDRSIEALYGFSAGGYNVKHILDELPERKMQGMIKLVVVLGAPGNPESSYKGPWELVYRTDPPEGHMQGPQALLDEFGPETHKKDNPPPVLSGWWQAFINHLIGK